MTSCTCCAKRELTICPVFESRTDADRQARIMLAIIRYMSKHNRCPHWQRTEDPSEGQQELFKV